MQFACLLPDLVFPIILHAVAAGPSLLQFLNCLSKVSLISESLIACRRSELVFPIFLHAGAAGSPLLQFLNCLSKVSLDSESPNACLPSELIFPTILHADATAGPPFPHFRNCLSHASVARHTQFPVRSVLRPVGRETGTRVRAARRRPAVRLSPSTTEPSQFRASIHESRSARREIFCKTTGWRCCARTGYVDRRAPVHTDSS